MTERFITRVEVDMILPEDYPTVIALKAKLDRLLEDYGDRLELVTEPRSDGRGTYISVKFSRLETDLEMEARLSYDARVTEWRSRRTSKG